MRAALRRSSVRKIHKPACEALERRRLLAAVNWDGGGDGVTWNDPINWSNNSLPGASDDVSLPAGGLVVLATSSVQIGSLVTARPLQVAGVNLAVIGDSALNATTTLVN